MVEEGGEVGGAGLELLDAVKAVALAVGLQQKRAQARVWIRGSLNVNVSCLWGRGSGAERYLLLV